MRTIKLPEGVSLMNICNAMLYASTAIATRKPNISTRWFDSQKDIMAANPDVDVWDDSPELTEVGALCHCGQRDAHEIAVYLTADELLAVQACLNDVTMGSMPDGHTTLNLWKAIQEIDDVIVDRLSDPSLR